MNSDLSTSTCTFDTFHGVRDHKKKRSAHMGGGRSSLGDEVNTSLMIKTDKAPHEGGPKDNIEKTRKLLEKLEKKGIISPCLMVKDGAKAKSSMEETTSNIKLSRMVGSHECEDDFYVITTVKSSRTFKMVKGANMKIVHVE